MTKKAAALHPGMFLRTEYLEKRLPGLSIAEFAAHLQMNRPHVSNTLNGQKSLGDQFALRLEAAGFETAEFWRDMQVRYDLAIARKTKQPKITRLLPPD